jgi:pilus assembly protein CpaD
MREMTQILLRGLCLTAVLMAGSCTSPFNDASGTFDDPLVNHPIMVEPTYQSLKLSYSAAGLDLADSGHLEAFVAAYRQHGNGKIAISVPNTAGMQQAVTSLADRINEMGVSRDQILVASHDAPNGDARVEINYISYQARTAPCGDWSEDLSYTADNKTAANFGCANQHNLAAMVSDPRDLLGPRPMDAADGRRRQTVITNYDNGTGTAAAKSADQSAAISDIGK